MFLSKEMKNAIDDSVKRNLPSCHADRIISENRKIKKYTIQAFTNRKDGRWVELGNLNYYTVKIVECDLDDAIEYKRIEAQKLGINPCHLRIVSEN